MEPQSGDTILEVRQQNLHASISRDQNTSNTAGAAAHTSDSGAVTSTQVSSSIVDPIIEPGVFQHDDGRASNSTSFQSNLPAQLIPDASIMTLPADMGFYRANSAQSVDSPDQEMANLQAMVKYESNNPEVRKVVHTCNKLFEFDRQSALSDMRQIFIKLPRTKRVQTCCKQYPKGINTFASFPAYMFGFRPNSFWVFVLERYMPEMVQCAELLKKDVAEMFSLKPLEIHKFGPEYDLRSIAAPTIFEIVRMSRFDRFFSMGPSEPHLVQPIHVFSMTFSSVALANSCFFIDYSMEIRCSGCNEFKLSPIYAFVPWGLNSKRFIQCTLRRAAARRKLLLHAAATYRSHNLRRYCVYDSN